MKKFKTADTWISIFLITGATIFGFARRNDSFIVGYFIVGGWQVISMIIHAVKGWFTEKGSRRLIYHYIVAATILITLGAMPAAPYISLFLLYALLFVAPLMAVYYSYICLHEVKLINRRPLDELK